jgi:hypothetical protein
MQLLQDAFEQEAGEVAAETRQSTEDQSMDVMELEASQAAFAEYVAS